MYRRTSWMEHRLGCRFAATLLLIAMATVIEASGCSASPEDKALIKPPGAGGNGGDGGDGGSGGNEPPPVGCDPEAEGGVGDDCGVFVSTTGEDGASGTKEAPFKSIDEAIRYAVDEHESRIYVCVGEYNEAVTVPAGVTIYARLNCKANWELVRDDEDGDKTVLTAPPGTVPLTISAGRGSARIQDLHVKAEDATMPGMSSIAAIADGDNVSLVRCVLEAGNAAPGAPGEAETERATQGGQGSKGNPACSASIVTPNDPPENRCGTTNDPDYISFGGLGGTGSPNSALPGTSGSPGEADNPNEGTRTSAGACGHGRPGRSGAPGTSKGQARGLGTITSAGYTGLPGEDGEPGKPGQGGGGGAGARGGSGACPAGSPGNGGASGGSGGAGGCGGKGGKGGGPGGSSIALISLDATLSFQDVRLIAKAGGEGGDGAPGQRGGMGGPGGTGGEPSEINPTTKGCDGGNGGDGGDGGQGGKGSDGHSLGIAFLGTPPPAKGVTFDIGTAPGNGIADDTLDFSMP